MLGPPDTDDDLEARLILARVRQRLAGVDEPARIGPYCVIERLRAPVRGVSTYLARDPWGTEVYLAVVVIRDPDRRARLLAEAAPLDRAGAPLLDGDQLCVAADSRAVGDWLRRAAAAR